MTLRVRRPFYLRCSLIAFFILFGFAEQLQAQFPVLHRVISMNDSTYEFGLTDEQIKAESGTIYTYFHYGRFGSTDGAYNGSLLDGSFSVLDASKHLIRRGNYEEGVKKGIWKYWNEQGTLLREEHWKKGRLDKIALYDPSGKIKEVGSYDHGTFNGQKFIYLDSSIRIDQYKDGQLVPEKPKRSKKTKKEKKQAQSSKDSLSTAIIQKSLLRANPFN